MGKNVLKLPGLVLGNLSALPRLLMFITIFVGVMTVDGEVIKLNFLKDLNFRIPHVSQWNISQAEYENKHQAYFDLVNENQRRRLNSPLNYDEENIVRKKLYTFTHSGLKNSPSLTDELNNFNYHIHIPEEPNKLTEIEDMSLRLLLVPKSCATEKQAITLSIVKTDINYYKKEIFHLNKCLPKWIGLDLSNGFIPNLKSSVEVSIGCRDCVDRDIDLRDPYLNVIVNVKRRLRRRRAEKKKKGKCMRHPWEVELAKLSGYEFIVQPKKFDAGLCMGKCNRKWNSATQHSFLQYLFAAMDKTIPKPCCSPSQMDKLEIMYPDEDDPKKLKIAIWNNTKVIQCACS